MMPLIKQLNMLPPLKSYRLLPNFTILSRKIKSLTSVFISNRRLLLGQPPIEILDAKKLLRTCHTSIKNSHLINSDIVSSLSCFHCNEENLTTEQIFSYLKLYSFRSLLQVLLSFPGNQKLFWPASSTISMTHSILSPPLSLLIQRVVLLLGSLLQLMFKFKM